MSRNLLLALIVLSTLGPAWSRPWVTVPRPPTVTAAEWGSQPRPFPAEMAQVPCRIVIHHAGVSWKPGSDPAQKMRELQSWGQREKGWLDVPYHFQIAPDGQIFEGRDPNFQPDSNTNYPLNGVLNVELFGNFQTDAVSRQQLESLVALLAYLCQTYELKPGELTSHRVMAPGQTVCPGMDLQRYLDGPLSHWVEGVMQGIQPALEPWAWPLPTGQLHTGEHFELAPRHLFRAAFESGKMGLEFDSIS